MPQAGLRDLYTTLLPPEAEVEVEGCTNAVTVAAFMLGLAVEELGARTLDPVDRRFPLVTLSRVRRPT